MALASMGEQHSQRCGIRECRECRNHAEATARPIARRSASMHGKRQRFALADGEQTSYNKEQTSYNKVRVEPQAFWRQPPRKPDPHAPPASPTTWRKRSLEDQTSIEGR